MQALNGSYAPSILTVRAQRDKLGQENQPRPYYRLLSIREGGYSLRVADEVHRVQDGDVCLIPPAVDCHADSDARARSQAIAFTVMACPLTKLPNRQGRRLAAGCPSQPAPQAIWGCRLPVVQPRAVSDQVRDLIALIVTECWHSEAQRLMCQQRLGFVLERIVWPHLDSEATGQVHEDHPIARVHSLVQARLSSLQTAADIAAHLGISLSQLNKTYRAATRGDTPAGFLRRYRLAETARLLLEGNAPLRKIAEQVGFRDDKALYKAWMRVYELPPRQWRQAQRYR